MRGDLLVLHETDFHSGAIPGQELFAHHLQRERSK